MQQSSLAFSGCDCVRILLILQVVQRELKMSFQILFEPLFSMFGLPDATEQLSLEAVALWELYSPGVSEGTKNELSDIDWRPV